MLRLALSVVLILTVAAPMGGVARAATVTIGVVGCSNTENAIDGYLTVSSEDRLWNLDTVSGDYGGDAISSWTIPTSDVWTQFDNLLARYPETSVIWWQLCVFRESTEGNEVVDNIVSLIRQRLPTAPIYASALDNTTSCTLGSPAKSQAFVDYLVGKGSVLAGPVMTALTADQSDDGCHANDAGKLIWGADLAEFFDGSFSGDRFIDVPATHPFYDDIEWLAAAGITAGCNAEGTRFCPENVVTRGEMAAFLVRSLGLPAATKDWFVDDQGSIFEDQINRLAEAGITQGCDAAQTSFCPTGTVTRGEMAAFLVRGYGYSAGVGADLFTDDDGSIFEDFIDQLATAGVTAGCGGTLYCPNSGVTRGQMAAFLHRAET
jgi:hypothetical protein